MGKTIMVVDDEVDIRDTLKAQLEANGYKVILAVNGDDCLKLLSEGAKPDLIILDVMMPGTPVKKVVDQIKDIKISFLSVLRSSEAETENLTKGENIVDYMQKPFDLDELLKKVKIYTS